MRLRAVCTRVKNSLADPVLRWKVIALMGGKMIGLALVLAAMKIFIAPPVYAADGPTPEMNALNTVWVLIAAFLVFCMQVGFVMLLLLTAFVCFSDISKSVSSGRAPQQQQQTQEQKPPPEVP